LNGTKPPEELTLDQVNAQEQAKRAVEDAQTDLQKAQLAYEVARKAEITAIADAEQELKAAQVAQQKLLAGPDKLELAAAQRVVNHAMVALDEAKAMQNDPEDEKQLEQARLDVENIRAKIEAGRVYAPFDGQVSEVTVRPGDSVAAYKPVVNIINPT